MKLFAILSLLTLMCSFAISAKTIKWRDQHGRAKLEIPACDQNEDFYQCDNIEPAKYALSDWGYFSFGPLVLKAKIDRNRNGTIFSKWVRHYNGVFNNGEEAHFVFPCDESINFRVLGRDDIYGYNLWWDGPNPFLARVIKEEMEVKGYYLDKKIPIDPFIFNLINNLINANDDIALTKLQMSEEELLVLGSSSQLLHDLARLQTQVATRGMVIPASGLSGTMLCAYKYKK